MSLSARQRQILFLMSLVDGPVAICGGTRGFHWGRPADPDTPYALVIKAYMSPEIWLENRGLIEKAPSNARPRPWRLTDAGRAAVLSFRVAPIEPLYIGEERIR